ncbi:MAG: GTP-binding protein, partial [Pseudomonadota bacterium]
EWLRFERAGKHEHTHHGHHHENANNHGNSASAYCFTAFDPVDPSDLQDGIRALQVSLGPNLLRMKGLVELDGYPDTPRVVHIAGHVVSPPRLLDVWPDGIDCTRIVLIVSGPDRGAAGIAFQKFVPQLHPYGDGVEPAKEHT